MRRALAWLATIACVIVAIALVAWARLDYCESLGGPCDEGQSFEGGVFMIGASGGALLIAPPLLLARCRWTTVVAATLAIALLLGFGAATG